MAIRAPLLALFLLAACGGELEPEDAAHAPAADASLDAGTSRADAASLDAAAVDAAGGSTDADGPSGGADATGADAGTPAGAHDAGTHDAGTHDACGTWTGSAPIRALFVGNSQIDFWDLPRLVSDLSASAPPACPRIVGERFTRGGANLRDLWEGTDSRGRRLADVLAARSHDVIVLAESIDLAEFRPPYPEQLVTYATRIAGAARAAGALPILYATPYVEASDDTGFHLMADDQIALAATLGIPIAAGGLAWLRVWSVRPDVDLYFVDRQHPGFRGSYLSALVIYAAITGATPIGLTDAPPTPVCDGAPCPPIPLDQAALFQRTAWEQHLETGI